jgi:hypothetical protein
MNEDDPQKLTNAIEELNRFLEENLINPEEPNSLQSA